jgi:two-component sensor histidine kinase
VVPGLESLTPQAPVIGAQATLSAEANHRIYNSLALVAGLLKMQVNELSARTEPVSVDDVRHLIADAAGRVDTVARLHRVLADAHSGSDVGIDGYIRDVTMSVVSSIAGPDDVIVSFDLGASDGLAVDDVLPVGMMVSELVSNAIKYAHPTGLATALTVRSRQTREHTLIEVRDDGIGLPEGFEPAKATGLGFRILRSLAAQIGANTTFDSTPLGLRVALMIPR